MQRDERRPCRAKAQRLRALRGALVKGRVQVGAAGTRVVGAEQVLNHADAIQREIIDHHAQNAHLYNHQLRDEAKHGRQRLLGQALGSEGECRRVVDAVFLHGQRVDVHKVKARARRRRVPGRGDLAPVFVAQVRERAVAHRDQHI